MAEEQLKEQQPEENKGERQNVDNPQYLPLENGFLIFDSGKMLKFGAGNKSIKTDYRYGFWAGSEIYGIAPFRVSSTGSVYAETILLTNNTTLPIISKARAYRDATQAITTDTWTKVQLNAETFDINNEFDSATNYRFTATVAGYYLVSGALKYTNVAPSLPFHIAFYKNGAVYSQIRTFTMALAGDDEGIGMSDIIYLTAGQYVELWTYHYMGGPTKNIMLGSDVTFMSIHRIS